MESLGPPLALLAAGVGSRFGGIKALAPVGPEGEALLIVSLQQARAAGFERAVIVVSDATEDAIRNALTGSPIPCSYVSQPRPQWRTKPLGTVDAVCHATPDDIDVVVANGDDLYGVAGLRAARSWLDGTVDGTVESTVDGAAILYRLDRTLPAASGGVSRAVVDRRADGRVTRISERLAVARHDDGIRDGDGRLIAPDQAVSMNLWCLRRRALRLLRDHLRAFVSTVADDAELGLPNAIDALVQRGALRVDAVVTDSTWHGVTWATDVAAVRAELIAAADPVR